MLDEEAFLVFRKSIFAVSQVKFAKGGKTKEPDSATGFFCGLDGQLYFITNRHNVIDEDDWFYPDELRLKLHTDQDDLTKNETFPIPLYDKEDKPAWLEHPKGKKIDVVALPVDGPTTSFFITPFNKENFGRADVYVSIGNDLIVVGYPLGLYDSKHNTPIIRSATIASVYPLPFEGEDYFLIDSRLHNGTSGSPVILKPQEYLIGIHSSQLEDTNLNIVWYAKLIPEIICSKKRGSIM
jgi:hypothetical protein